MFRDDPAAVPDAGDQGHDEWDHEDERDRAVRRRAEHPQAGDRRDRHATEGPEGRRALLPSRPVRDRAPGLDRLIDELALAPDRRARRELANGCVAPPAPTNS